MLLVGDAFARFFVKGNVNSLWSPLYVNFNLHIKVHKLCEKIAILASRWVKVSSRVLKRSKTSKQSACSFVLHNVEEEKQVVHSFYE